LQASLNSRVSSRMESPVSTYHASPWMRPPAAFGEELALTETGEEVADGLGRRPGRCNRDVIGGEVGVGDAAVRREEVSAEVPDVDLVVTVVVVGEGGKIARVDGGEELHAERLLQTVQARSLVVSCTRSSVARSAEETVAGMVASSPG
jgi:hypothetical protein